MAGLAGHKPSPGRWPNTEKPLTEDQKRRLALAKWITDRGNPLTVRVTLTQPDGSFLFNMAWGDAIIVARNMGAAELLDIGADHVHAHAPARDRGDALGGRQAGLVDQLDLLLQAGEQLEGLAEVADAVRFAIYAGL